MSLCLCHQVSLSLRTPSLQSPYLFLSLQYSLPQHGFVAIMFIWSPLITSLVHLLTISHAPIRICTLCEQASGGTGLFLPPASRTVCLVPSSCSEKKQEATFLPGGIRKGFMGERERLAEKSQRTMMIQDNQNMAPSPRCDLICRF